MRFFPMKKKKRRFFARPAVHIHLSLIRAAAFLPV
jgi:hypothetical protein